MGGLEENARLPPFRGGAQFPFALAAFDRQESAEREGVGEKSGADESANDGGRPRQNSQWDLTFDAFANEPAAGIGQARCACVGDQCNVVTGGEPLQQLCRAHRFIMFVITHEWLLYSVMLEQDAGMSCVLSSDNMDGLKHC